MRIELGHEEPPEIGLIALIDCIFFLLMFFMIATSFKQDKQQKQDKELPVTLPTAQASLAINGAAGAPLVIGVDAKGKIYIDGDRMGVQAFHDRLKKEAAANPRRRIRIDGDQRAEYQHIVRVLDLCQFEGFTNIAMRTRK